MRISFAELITLEVDRADGPDGFAQGSINMDRPRGVIARGHLDPPLDGGRDAPGFGQRISLTGYFILQGGQTYRPGILMLSLRMEQSLF